MKALQSLTTGSQAPLNPHNVAQRSTSPALRHRPEWNPPQIQSLPGWLKMTNCVRAATLRPHVLGPDSSSEVGIVVAGGASRSVHCLGASLRTFVREFGGHRVDVDVFGAGVADD